MKMIIVSKKLRMVTLTINDLFSDMYTYISKMYNLNNRVYQNFVSIKKN